MNLHENNKLFRQAVRYAAQEMKIKPIYVEKDYWVCFVLDLIYMQEYRNEILFKGGTSISKCFDLLNRFSEDIDLVVLKKKRETDREHLKKRNAISNLVSKELPEIHVEGFTKKKGPNRRSAHQYKKEFSGKFGQVKDTIYIDASHMESYEPQMKSSVKSYVGIKMEESQPGMIEEYNMHPIEVNVLDPTRTICDKIMNLVRMSHTDDPITNIKRRIRHTYDLHILLRDERFSGFFESDNFDRMMSKVIEHDRKSYDNVNRYLDKHPKDALIFIDTENVWNQLSKTYSGEFKDLVYGELPREQKITETLKRISDRLSRMTWPPV